MLSQHSIELTYLDAEFHCVYLATLLNAWQMSNSVGENDIFVARFCQSDYAHVSAVWPIPKSTQFYCLLLPAANVATTC